MDETEADKPAEPPDEPVKPDEAGADKPAEPPDEPVKPDEAGADKPDEAEADEPAMPDETDVDEPEADLGTAPAEPGATPGGTTPTPPATADLSGLGIYDVLMNPDHPEFLNLGRLLWILVATPWDWVDRRVETVSLVGERRFRRHMSVDCRVPRVVTDLAAELGFDHFFVPLRLVAERPLLSFDLQLGGEPVPFLTTVQHTMVERAVLRAAVEHLGRPLTDELLEILDQVAAPGQSSAAGQALEMLELSGPPGRRGFGAEATAEALVHWAITALDRQFLILADVPLDQLRHRALFKITEERGTEVTGPLPLQAEIAWRPSAFMFDADDVVAAGSYHFQFIAPDGLVMAGGELLAGGEGSERGDQAPDLSEEGLDVGGEPRGGVPFGAVSSHGQVLGVYTHLDEVPSADRYVVRAWLRPSPDGLLRASAISACFSTALLLAAVVFVDRLDDSRLEASAALLLVLPSLVSSLWLRPGEHSLVSRLYRGTRTLLLVNVVIMYLAAASILVVGAAPDHLRVIWTILALLTAVPAGALVRALRRSQTFPMV